MAYIKEVRFYGNHPDRFTDPAGQQVLNIEPLTGRCYCEVEWTEIGVGVAVTYRNISRAGRSEQSSFGLNDKSWSLICYSGGQYEFFFHKNIGTVISGRQSSRVGVYLDHRAGLLSFHSISRTMKVLHRVQTHFSQLLYIGFSVC